MKAASNAPSISSGKTTVAFTLNGPSGHVHLKPVLTDGGHVLAVHVDERYVLPGPGQTPSDDTRRWGRTPITIKRMDFYLC